MLEQSQNPNPSPDANPNPNPNPNPSPNPNPNPDQVACAPDEGGELCRLIDWLLGVWRAFATQLPLEQLARDALGDAGASALWEAMRERCYRWRFLNEARDRLERCEAVERLLPQFERGVLRSGWAAVPGSN